MGPYYYKFDQLYCPEDYAELYLPKCVVCHQPILGIWVRVDGHFWHSEHFTCGVCQRPIEFGTEFYKYGRTERLYCRQDYLSLHSTPERNGVGPAGAQGVLTEFHECEIPVAPSLQQEPTPEVVEVGPVPAEPPPAAAVHAEGLNLPSAQQVPVKAKHKQGSTCLTCLTFWC